MEIIWIAIFLYSIGLAAVLYLRPALMFNENGTWKEFGYKRDDARYTIFPFWLFAVVWAFLAYALAAVVTGSITGAGMTMASAASASASHNFSWSDEEDTDEEFERVSEKEKAKKPRPGYYVLNAGTKKGIRKYVYYGQEPPEQ